MRLLGGLHLSLNQWHAMFLKKILFTFRNKFLFAVQNFMPIFFVSMTIVITRQQGVFFDLQPLLISLSLYPIAVTVLEKHANVVSDTLADRIATQYQSIVSSMGHQYEYESTGSRNFTEYIIELGKTKQVHVNSRYLASATVTNNNITAWLNNQPFHTAPLTVNLVHNAMAK